MFCSNLDLVWVALRCLLAQPLTTTALLVVSLWPFASAEAVRKGLRFLDLGVKCRLRENRWLLYAFAFNLLFWCGRSVVILGSSARVARLLVAAARLPQM